MLQRGYFSYILIAGNYGGIFLKKERVRDYVAAMLEVPKEAAFSLPLITMVGNNDIMIENHLGISEYTAEHIKIKTSAGNISIFGNMLTIKMISADNIEIKGKVDKLEVMK